MCTGQPPTPRLWICRGFWGTAQTPGNWIKQHERDSGQRDGRTTDDAQRIRDLEREVRELRKANEILKLASAFLAQAELDRRIKSQRPSSISVACTDP